MSILTIQGPAERGRDPRQISVRTGGSATFGICGCGGCALDLRLPAQPPVDFRGEIVVGPDRWRIANRSNGEPVIVTQVDGRADPTAVRPGEWLPFCDDMATVTPSAATAGPLLTVFFTADAGAAEVGAGCPAITPRPGPELDPGARYFAVLAALCEPVLLDGRAGRVPTSSDIGARLALSPRAVDSHIDYLVGKFAIVPPHTRSTGWKRRALIKYVRRHDGVAQALLARRDRQPATAA